MNTATFLTLALILVGSGESMAAEPQNLGAVLADIERAEDGIVLAELERYNDDDRWVYELDYYRNGSAYELTFDALTGEILSDREENRPNWWGDAEEDLQTLKSLNVTLAEAVALFEEMGTVEEVHIADEFGDRLGYFVRFEDDREMFVSGTSGKVFP